jgi:hypothetical protein
MKKKFNPVFSFVMGVAAIAIATFLIWAGFTSYLAKTNFAAGMHEGEATVRSVHSERYVRSTRWVYDLEYDLPGLSTYPRLAYYDSAYLPPKFSEGQVITVEINPDYNVAYLPSAFSPISRFSFLAIALVAGLPMLAGGVIMIVLPFMRRKKKLAK